MAPKVKMGRPSKLNALVIAKIAEAISYGLTDQECADLVNVNIAQLTKWKHLPGEPYVSFRAAIKKQCVERLIFRLKTVEAAKGHWVGCAWILERMYPTRFSKPEVQLNISNTLNQNTLNISLTPEEAKEIEGLAAPIREETAKLFEAYRPTKSDDMSSKR